VSKSPECTIARRPDGSVFDGRIGQAKQMAHYLGKVLARQPIKAAHHPLQLQYDRHRYNEVLSGEDELPTGFEALASEIRHRAALS